MSLTSMPDFFSSGRMQLRCNYHATTRWHLCGEHSVDDKQFELVNQISSMRDSSLLECRDVQAYSTYV